MRIQKREQEVRATLTDVDLRGRDVITLICETQMIDLLEHKYVQKLADQVWDGPQRVNRSLLFLNTSVITLECLAASDEALQDPFEIRRDFQQKKQVPRWDMVTSWGFSAWRDGLNVRYTVYLLICFFLVLLHISTLIMNFKYSERSLSNVSFLFQGQFQGFELDGRLQFNCNSRSFTQSTLSQDQKYLAYYKSKWGESLFNQYVDHSMNYICYTYEYLSYVSKTSLLKSFFYLFLPFSLILQATYLRKSDHSLKRTLCRDLTLLQVSAFLLLLDFVLQYRSSFKYHLVIFEFSNGGALEYWKYMQSISDFLSIFIAFLTIVISLRFYFSLKATRLFGSFTKLVKLNAVDLSQWLLFTLFLLVSTSNYFSILLSQNQACSGLYSCIKGLIESSIGRTDFSKTDDNWAANFSLMIVAYILAAVLMNMVIAKMNSTYQEVRRKGTLLYYKELFDLRYLYKLNNRYGFLVALEHPLSLILLPTLCIVKCLERRRKKQLLKQSLHFLNERIQRTRGQMKWRCCCCFKCEKKSKYAGMQLQDFNHAMLRAIYAFYLIFFSLVVFSVGAFLLPLSTLAMIVTRVRIVRKQWALREKKENFMLKVKGLRGSQAFMRALRNLLVFIPFGIFILFWKNILDTLQFIQVCWKDEKTEIQKPRGSFTLTMENLNQIANGSEQLLKLQLPCQEVDMNHPIESLKESIIPEPAQLQPNQNIYLDTLALNICCPDNLQSNQHQENVTDIYSEIQEQRKSRRILTEVMNQAQCDLFKQIASLLVTLSIQKKATQPFRVPLSILIRVIKGTLANLATQNRLKAISSFPVPILEGGFKRKRPPSNIRIDTHDSRGALQISESSFNEPRGHQERRESGYLTMFRLFCSLYAQKECIYDPHTLVYLRLQKVIDATEEVKVREIEEEEAIKKVEAHLESYLPLL